MKVVIFTVAALVAAGSVSAAEKLADWQSHALERLEKQPEVVRARWRSASKHALWIAIAPEHYRAARVERYVCDMLRDVGQPPGDKTEVYIFDPPSFRSNGWPMGTVKCH